MKSKVELEELSENIPYEELTVLLHKSYSKHKAENLNFAAISQSVEDTKLRIGDGCCILARIDNKLVGTISYHIKDEKNSKYWYKKGKNVYLYQLAVDPDYNNGSVLLALIRYITKRVYSMPDINATIIDTSTQSANLIKYYQLLNFSIVDYVSWPNTNYYSYIFYKPIHGTVYDKAFCAKKLKSAKLKCILTKTKEGKVRMPFKPFCKFKNYIVRILRL